MKLLAVLGCLLSLSSAFATVTVPIADHSPSGCPLANSGTVTVVERLDSNKSPWEGITGEWEARNNSGKPIIATVTTVRVHYSNGVRGMLVSVEDFFWNPDLPVDKVPTSVNSLTKGVQLTEGPISESATAESLRPQASRSWSTGCSLSMAQLGVTIKTRTYGITCSRDEGLSTRCDDSPTFTTPKVRLSSRRRSIN